MENLFNNIINYLLPSSDIFLYTFLFMSAVVENLFPPIPGDTITAFGAFLVGTGRLNYFLVFLSTTLGSVSGFLILFFIGRFLGREFFLKKNYKSFSSKNIFLAERWFQKYGYLVVLANRFLPGIRSVISIISGISFLNPLKVFLYSLISASIWNLIWIQAGYTLGNNWDVVKNKLGIILCNYNVVVSIILISAIVAFIIYKIRNRAKNNPTTVN